MDNKSTLFAGMSFNTIAHVFDHYECTILPERLVITKIKVKDVNREIAETIMYEANTILLTSKEHPCARYYPSLLDLSDMVSADEETMHFISTNQELVENETAMAFLLSNEINALVFDVFEQFLPGVPVKAFFSQDEALEWLKQFDYTKNPKVIEYMAKINADK